VNVVVSYTLNGPRRSPAFASWDDALAWAKAARETWRRCKPEVVPAEESDGPPIRLERPVLLELELFRDGLTGNSGLRLNGRVYFVQFGPSEVTLGYFDRKGAPVAHHVRKGSCTCDNWRFVVSRYGGLCKHQMAVKKLGLLTPAAAAV
jgi:hypothetical protein